MSWQEAFVLGLVATGASVVAALGSFDPLPVYVGILGWGGRAVASK
jgi:hypothetical protein